MSMPRRHRIMWIIITIVMIVAMVLFPILATVPLPGITS